MYSAITFQQNPWFMLYEAENFARCLLLVVHYFLLVARCSLPFVCCSLVFARCPSIFAACLLLFPRCLLLFARWLLLFALCSLFIHPNYGEINYCEPQKKWLDYNETPPQIFSLQNSKILVTFSGWQFSKFPQHVKPFFKGDIKSQILPELISLWCFITISGHVFLYFYVLEEPEVVVRKISIKKVFLNIPHNSQKNICAEVSFAISCNLEACNVIKYWIWYRCFLYKNNYFPDDCEGMFGVSFRKILGFYYKRKRQLFHYEGTSS